MFQHFDEIIQNACGFEEKKTIAICAADDETMVHTAAEAAGMGLCNVIMAGNEQKIRTMLEQYPKTAGIRVVQAKDRMDSCRLMVRAVRDGEAQVYVKGNVNTSDFLRSVLDREIGLRTERKLNVLSCYEIPGRDKLLFLADGGMIVAPDLQDKIDILENCVPVLHQLGVQEPKVAILAANERVSENIPATVDAQKITELAEQGRLPKGIYEGPIALDVILRREAAEKKGIVSRVSGDVDFILVPNIETGNALGKAMGYFGGAVMAGMVAGAAKPVIMSSRAASLKSKLTSIAWALLTSCGKSAQGGN